MAVRFSSSAKKDFARLPHEAQSRILDTLWRYDAFNNPLAFAKPLHGGRIGDYRFRIGPYRAVCAMRDGDIIVLAVGDRKDIYR